MELKDAPTQDKLDTRERVISPKEFCSIGLNTLQSTILEKLKGLNSLMQGIDSSHPLAQAAKSGSGAALEHTLRLIQVTQAAMRGEPVEIVERNTLSFFNLNTEDEKGQLPDTEIIAKAKFNPKSKTHQAKIADLFGQTIQDSIIQDLGIASGFAELASVRVPGYPKSDAQNVISTSAHIATDLKYMDNSRQTVFLGKPIGVRINNGIQTLVLPKAA